MHDAGVCHATRVDLSTTYCVNNLQACSPVMTYGGKGEEMINAVSLRRTDKTDRHTDMQEGRQTESDTVVARWRGGER